MLWPAFVQATKIVFTVGAGAGCFAVGLVVAQLLLIYHLLWTLAREIRSRMFWECAYRRFVACSRVFFAKVEQSQMALTRKKAVAMVKKIPVMTWNATKAIVLFLWEIIKNPLVLKDKLGVAQYHLKEVCG